MGIIVEVLLQPVLSSLDGGRADWPTLGVVLAWLVVAALLGTLLNRLRKPAGRAGEERRRPRSIAAARRRRSGALQRGPSEIVASS